MEQIELNKILNREQIAIDIKNILTNFDANRNNLLFKRGIYLYGDPGTGKTTFVTNILKEMNYDIVKYDAGDVRNKNIIDTITKHNMSDKNIMSVFQKKIKKIAIIMDEIDGMNGGDKGGINSLIKLIRPKKTKKQKLEDVTVIPIICIGNYHVDKKIKELIKVCDVIELKTPTIPQINSILKSVLHEINDKMLINLTTYIQGDLRKLNNVCSIFKNNPHIINNDFVENIFQLKSYNDDTKHISQKLLNKSYSIDEHLIIMNETDRTIVGLLWHENIIDVLSKMDKNISIPFYIKQLENICAADYIDRITFQRQIWQFNEMSSLIKTFKNNKLYTDTFKERQKYNPVEVRFTKVLTKYSTEYNNYIFMQDLCQKLNMDKKDLISFFLELKSKYTDDNEILNLFENYDISKLDINRIYRYINKYITENAESEDEDEISVIEECPAFEC